MRDRRRCGAPQRLKPEREAAFVQRVLQGTGADSGLSAWRGEDLRVALILDGAGWHKSQAMRIPGNLTLLHLPPYAPELDLALKEAWRRLSDDPERLRQLTHFDWIQQALDSHNQGQNEGQDTS